MRKLLERGKKDWKERDQSASGGPGGVRRVTLSRLQCTGPSHRKHLFDNTGIQQAELAEAEAPGDLAGAD